MIRAALIALAAYAFVSIGSCSIDTRSDAFRCDNGACPTGRVCESGWCVSTGAPDAPVIDSSMLPDGFVCPSECSSCSGDTCIISCTTAGACTSPVVCPTGMPCMVDCAGDNACAGGIDCTKASSCQISCGGNLSCAGATACGTGACNVSCGGPSSCKGAIACSQSCKCDTSCGGAGSCGTAPSCPAPLSQCRTGKICTSAPNSCHSC